MRPMHIALKMVIALLVCGCPWKEGSLCNAKCDCELCSDSQHDQCRANLDADSAFADRLGCTALYDHLVDCQNQTGFCRGVDWETSCGPEKDAYKRCTGEDPGKGK